MKAGGCRGGCILSMDSADAHLKHEALLCLNRWHGIGIRVFAFGALLPTRFVWQDFWLPSFAALHHYQVSRISQQSQKAKPSKLFTTRSPSSKLDNPTPVLCLLCLRAAAPPPQSYMSRQASQGPGTQALIMMFSCQARTSAQPRSLGKKRWETEEGKGEGSERIRNKG